MKYNVCCIALSCLLFSCSSNDTSQQTEVRGDSVSLGERSEHVKLKLFTHEEAARYTIASVMGYDPKTIQVKSADDIFYATYVSGDVYYIYKVMFKADKILWGVREGRWRGNDAEEKITYKEDGQKIKIIQTFTDGTQSIDVYTK